MSASRHPSPSDPCECCNGERVRYLARQGATKCEIADALNLTLREVAQLLPAAPRPVFQREAEA